MEHWAQRKMMWFNKLKNLCFNFSLFIIHIRIKINPFYLLKKILISHLSHKDTHLQKYDLMVILEPLKYSLFFRIS